ncbi:MAG TPA: MazG nucleotide pyrophosphohydrolase domain-containing protein [Nevskiaceae bacterium]|nr:MazG nucleotide pyrophosphohydrolase domain-containing protein [Nevskiaceae bacterium]
MTDPIADALKLQLDAAAQGFDWRQADELWPKLAEEIAELREAAGQGPDRIRDELGDLLFMAVNLARHLGVDPAAALAGSNEKFRRRFGHVCRHRDRWAPEGDPSRLESMEALWQEAKQLGL